jgi:hypothetical protein
MDNNFDVDILSIWDGVDQKIARLADLKLRFLDLDPPEELFGPSTKDLFILTDLEVELQYLADKRFGKGKIKAECVRILRGSLEVLVTLTAVGSAAFVFFKDYKDFREGILLFVADVKSAAAELRGIAKKRLSRKKEGGAEKTKNDHDRENKA